MNLRNSLLSAFVIGRPPNDRMISSARSSVSTPLAGYQFTAFIFLLGSALVRAEEACVGFVVFLAVADGIVKNVLQG
jgi:hypothetical protein